jgi:hypothetical protein|tara:strand:+ start:282 stop:725 length:444 start_codon:yes stop_codon:yes gene_type:complete
MKKLLLVAILAMISFTEMNAQEFKVVTIVESIVPMGVGRSRIVEHQQDSDHKAHTTERVDGKKSKEKKSKRADAKIGEFSETKLLNFYSGVGINFQNIASNDSLITSKINHMIEAGWKLTYVSSAVESNAGKGDGKGIFITRLYFSK